jgi:hypothetical protein
MAKNVIWNLSVLKIANIWCPSSVHMVMSFLINNLNITEKEILV